MNIVVTVRSNAALLALLFTVFSSPAHGQFSYRRTVGDNTANNFQPGGLEAIKYRGNIISNPNLSKPDLSVGNLTRHTRQGSSTGIGGSTFQTTSVTSETRPALVRPSSFPIGSSLIERPTFNLHFASTQASPALKTFDIRYPDSGESDFFGRVPESFTNSNILPTFEKEENTDRNSDFQSSITD
jgi:hypothetical protein